MGHVKEGGVEGAGVFGHEMCISDANLLSLGSIGLFDVRFCFVDLRCLGGLGRGGRMLGGLS